MPERSLFVTPAVPKILRITVTHQPEVLEAGFSVCVVVEPTKGSGGRSREVAWPDGAVELLGSACDAVATAFVRCDTMIDVTDALGAAIIAARVKASQQQF